MRNSKIVFLITIFFIGISSIMAQTTQSNHNNKTEATSQKAPQAIVTLKTLKKPNQLIEQVNILTKGDDVLTEKTISEIRKTKNTSIIRIVSDTEYDKLTIEMQHEAIKESEVVKIINQIKK